MILGAIIGDVIGKPYEFHNIKTKEFSLVSKDSRFSDDSVMTLAIASALRKWKKGSVIDENEFEDAVIKAMKYFGRRYPNAGYGGGFKNWLYSHSSQPYGSYGNGSAMRVSPVAWYFDDLESVEKFAEITARVTHNHPEGIKGAQATAAAIFLARTGKSKAEIKKYIEEKYKYDLNRTCNEIRPFYEFDASCQGTVPEAIIAFLEGENFEDAIRNAVSLGGDCDTLTDITAAISEGMWGVPKRIEEAVLPCLDDFFIAELEKWERALNGESSKEKIKNGITELVFILDRSGSMSGREGDTIGGFNSVIKKQKNEQETTHNESFVSTVLFDHEQIVLHDRVKLSEIGLMTEKDYWTRGSTALLDAVGGAIHHIARIHRYERPSLVPEHTLFVIITDGMENASQKYSYANVKEMIETEKNEYGWEFIFLGANIDAAGAAADIGISRNYAVNYMADEQGFEAVYEGVNAAIKNVRACYLEERQDWRKSIDRDYERRNRPGKNKPQEPDDNIEDIILFRRRK